MRNVTEMVREKFGLSGHRIFDEEVREIGCEVENITASETSNISMILSLFSIHFK